MPQGFYKRSWETIKSGKSFRGAVTNTKNREIWFYNQSVVPLKDFPGNISGFISVGKNISEVKRLNETLRQSEEKYRRLVELLPEAIAIHSKDKVIYVNPAGTELMGAKNPKELIGKPMIDFVHPDYREIVKERVWKILEEGKKMPLAKEKYIRVDGEIITVEATGMSITYQGSPAVLAVFRDITNRKEAEQELVEAKKRAELLDRLKSSFLNIVSHEVRTPLNAIIGYTDLLKTDLQAKLTEEQEEFCKMILQSGDRLKQLVDDILEVSQIETDKTMLDLKWVTADELIGKSVAEIIEIANAKNLKVREHYHVSGVQIQVDEVRFQQAISKILQNAVKFTNEGSITITTKAYNGEFQMAIADTGIGIKDDFKPYLFALFRQEDEGYTRRYEGAGLGLAVSQRLITAMDGRIEVESQEGKGSTFTIYMPRGRVIKGFPGEIIRKTPPKIIKVESKNGVGEIPLSPKKPEEGKRTVLVLEDNPANLAYSGFLVKRLGYRQVSVESGEEALELLKDNTVDAILIDISLGKGMTGIEFVNKIKRRKSFKNVPLIAVTAHAGLEIEKRLLGEGFDDYLAKPFKIKDLRTVLARNMIKSFKEIMTKEKVRNF